MIGILSKSDTINGVIMIGILSKSDTINGVVMIETALIVYTIDNSKNRNNILYICIFICIYIYMYIDKV